ncbi:MAG: 50S ribosomal protein L11 methyltransferase [Polyangiaceae bacterium]
MTPKTRLRRAAPLDVRFDSAGLATVRHAGGSVHAGPHTLAILDAFARPKTFEEGLRELGIRAPGAESWMELSSAVVSLARVGVLVEVDSDDRRLSETGGFGSVRSHAAMLDDRARTSAFVEAVAKVVRPGDVVVDIGTGTGILAMAAARAGARRVYAVESSAIAKVARRAIVANGFSDVVEVVEGWSTEVTLPERCDVLVTELIGDDPLCERIVEVVADARKRLLKDDARVIPEELVVSVVPVTLDGGRTPTTVDAASIARWREWYGFDLSALRDALGDESPRVMRPAVEMRSTTALGPDVTTFSMDLRAGVRKVPSVDRDGVVPSSWDVSGTIDAPGQLEAFVMCFDARLAEGIRISTHPARVDDGICWLSAVWPVHGPKVVAAGASYALRITHAADGALRVRLLP